VRGARATKRRTLARSAGPARPTPFRQLARRLVARRIRSTIALRATAYSHGAAGYAPACSAGGAPDGGERLLHRVLHALAVACRRSAGRTRTDVAVVELLRRDAVAVGDAHEQLESVSVVSVAGVRSSTSGTGRRCVGGLSASSMSPSSLRIGVRPGFFAPPASSFGPPRTGAPPRAS
jgi:hypothetical protein